MMYDLVIFGAGGHAREMRQLVDDINHVKPSWNLLGFLDDNCDLHATPVKGLPVLGDLEWLRRYPRTFLVVAVGNPSVRRRIVKQVSAVGHSRFATLIHPSASVGKRVSIGEGTMICAGAVVTTDVRIGRHVILNVSCSVSHDSILEDYTTLAPGARVPGNVYVGEGADLGVNASTLPGTTIGAWSVLGAGALAVRDVPPNVIMVGVPARVIRRRSQGWHMPSLNS